MHTVCCTQDQDSLWDTWQMKSCVAASNFMIKEIVVLNQNKCNRLSIKREKTFLFFKSKKPDGYKLGLKPDMNLLRTVQLLILKYWLVP